jgi:hypothetical protein
MQQWETIRFIILSGRTGNQSIVALNYRVLVLKTGFLATGSWLAALVSAGTISSYEYQHITGVQITQHALGGGFIELILSGGPKCKGAYGVPDDHNAWRLPNCVPLISGTLDLNREYLNALQQLVADASR